MNKITKIRVFSVITFAATTDAACVGIKKKDRHNRKPYL
jgi:hypothetical protein